MQSQEKNAAAVRGWFLLSTSVPSSLKCCTALRPSVQTILNVTYDLAVKQMLKKVTTYFGIY